MNNTEKASRAIKVLNRLIEQHVIMFETNGTFEWLKKGTVCQRDECSFLWIPLLQYAFKSLAHGLVIRHEEDDRPLQLEMAKLVPEFVRRGLLEPAVCSHKLADLDAEYVIKGLLAHKMSELEKQIKSESITAYEYITGKTDVYGN